MNSPKDSGQRGLGTHDQHISRLPRNSSPTTRHGLPHPRLPEPSQENPPSPKHPVSVIGGFDSFLPSFRNGNIPLYQTYKQGRV